MMTEAMLCRVCGEAVDESNSAACNSCGQRYHLRLRQDREGKDCGQVWVNEEFLALEFACFVCLGSDASAGEPREPPVGDCTEPWWR